MAAVHTYPVNPDTWKFRALYNACSVANIPSRFLGHIDVEMFESRKKKYLDTLWTGPKCPLQFQHGITVGPHWLIPRTNLTWAQLFERWLALTWG